MTVLILLVCFRVALQAKARPSEADQMLTLWFFLATLGVFRSSLTKEESSSEKLRGSWKPVKEKKSLKCGLRLGVCSGRSPEPSASGSNTPISLKRWSLMCCLPLTSWVSAHVCTCVCAHTPTRMRAHTCTCVCAYARLHTRACTHTHTHAHTAFCPCPASRLLSLFIFLSRNLPQL